MAFKKCFIFNKIDMNFYLKQRITQRIQLNDRFDVFYFLVESEICRDGVVLLNDFPNQVSKYFLYYL